MRDPLPTPIYGSVIVALAVFFLGLTVWRSPIEGYLVTAEVKFSGVRTPADSTPAGSHADVVSLQRIADAVRAADRQTSPQRTRALSEHRLSEIARNVTCVASGVNGGDGGFTVSFQGRELRWSLAMVDHLVRQITIDRSTIRPSDVEMGDSVRQAKWLLELAQHYERKARFDVEDALHTYFEQLASTKDGFSNGALDANESEPLEDVAVAARQPNPGWERLQAELARLTRNFRELLQSVTPDHPQARHIAAQIEQLRSEIETTPKHIDSGAQHAAALAKQRGYANAENTWEAQPAAFSAQEELDTDLSCAALSEPKEYQEMRDRYEGAIERRELAGRRYSELVALHQVHSRQSPASAPEVIRPADLVGQIGGRPAGVTVLGLGLLALVCGAFVYRWTASLNGSLPISSVEELQSTLALPLAGRISIDPMSVGTRRRARWARWVPRCHRAGEILLAAMIVLFLFSVFRDSPAAQEMADNPLGTFVHRIADGCGK